MKKFTEWMNMQENILDKHIIDELVPILNQFHIPQSNSELLATAISAGLAKGMSGNIAFSHASKTLNSGQMGLVNFIRNHK